MKKLIAAVFAVALATAAFAGGNATNQTAQGIMVNLKSSGTFAIETTNVYRFDQLTAAGYFVNAWDGATPTYTCSGNACNGDVCGVPAAPAAPAPDDDVVFNPGGSGAADKSRCTFLDGGELTRTDSYTQTASTEVSCTVGYDKKGLPITKTATYTFAYNYVVAPLAGTASVAPFTAWPLHEQSDAGLAHIDLDADIAGESVLAKGPAGSQTKKFSFSMKDSYGNSRVTGITVSVTDANGAAVPVSSTSPGSTVIYPVDFRYTTNAGSNGVLSLLADGDARTILNTDSFAGNDDGGADGSALALARMDTVGMDVGPGTFTVSLSGTVKDNSASLANIPFNVTESVVIVTPGCGQGN